MMQTLEAYLRAHKNLIELRGCQGDLQRDERLWVSALELAREVCDEARDAFAAELWAAGFPTEEAGDEALAALGADELRARLQAAADRSGRRQRAKRSDGTTELVAPKRRSAK
jgi:hypothetical protein